MKKKIIYSFFFLFLILLLFLNLKGVRYTGIDYTITEEKISNFKKIKEFYSRYNNYKNLVKKITNNLNKKDEIIEISKWVHVNINKKKENDQLVDSHPWTIVERRIGAKDQFSDILSVLLVINNIDAFFISKINKTSPLTFFKFNNKWSIIDPYYGFYFVNNNNQFCSIIELKLRKCFFIHLKYENISDTQLKFIFFDKEFNNYEQVRNYYNFLAQDIPSETEIENENIYLRGGRSYIQKPYHRLIYQIQKLLNII